MSPLDIGNSIRNRRKELKVNQRTVADLSGVAVNTVVAIERGEGNPQLSSLLAILDTLGLQIDITIKKLNDETV
ncbi:MAG: helix-turn-helix transcriptional regulator [Bacteroidales bacterium]|nr:helix-turn-helix transcriptional regulator [Bacteroidales bacterium]